ncbi:MAG: hypothetical protein DME79_03300 [Verrucomicrobia bacterium]|nr:MAG: hypothetical protein DME79_03300 [Verrucomicrobiota bacterium]PYJ56649.1 MAG: hypothetical protein DME82_04130 [Verrucomicrobiota bacterium]
MTHKTRGAINPEHFRGQPISDPENRWTNSPSQIKTHGYDPALDLLLILPILHLTWDNPN